MSAYCAVNWTPWLCRDFPHFFQNHAVILPFFYRDFNTSLDMTRHLIPDVRKWCSGFAQRTFATPIWDGFTTVRWRPPYRNKTHARTAGSRYIAVAYVREFEPVLLSTYIGLRWDWMTAELCIQLITRPNFVWGRDMKKWVSSAE